MIANSFKEGLMWPFLAWKLTKGARFSFFLLGLIALSLNCLSYLVPKELANSPLFIILNVFISEVFLIASMQFTFEWSQLKNQNFKSFAQFFLPKNIIPFIPLIIPFIFLSLIDNWALPLDSMPLKLLIAFCQFFLSFALPLRLFLRLPYWQCLGQSAMGTVINIWAITASEIPFLFSFIIGVGPLIMVPYSFICFVKVFPDINLTTK